MDTLKAELESESLEFRNLAMSKSRKDGPTLAGQWWGINVTWPWIEDYEPYSITGKYIDYTTLFLPGI